MPRQSEVYVHGTNNIVATNVYVQLLPPLSGSGSVSRKRAWFAALVATGGGAMLANYDTLPVVAGCGAALSLVTLCFLLRGGASGEARADESAPR